MDDATRPGRARRRAHRRRAPLAVVGCRRRARSPRSALAELLRRRRRRRRPSRRPRVSPRHQRRHRRSATSSADSAGPPATVDPGAVAAGARRAHHLREGRDRAAAALGAARHADLAAVFDAATLAPATTTDRGVVLDEGLPKVTGDLDVVTASRSRSSASATRAATSRWSPRPSVVDVNGADRGQGRPAAHRPQGRLRARSPTRRRVEDHRVQHGRRPATAPASSPTTTTTHRDDDRSREVTGTDRAAAPLTLLVVAPVLCGLLARRRLTAAWLVLGEPVPAEGAVWFQVTKLGAARDDRRAAAAVLRARARHRRAVRRPGAVARRPRPRRRHPRDRREPGAASRRRSSTSRATPRGRAAPSSTRTSSTTRAATTCAPRPTRCRRSSACRSRWVIRANFPHFQQMVDEIGGIDVNIPTPMDDDFSGAHFAAGPAHLNGEQALQFSRDRHSFANGDLTRTSNQGLLIVVGAADAPGQEPERGRHRPARRHARAPHQARRRRHLRPVPHGLSSRSRSIPPT